MDIRVPAQAKWKKLHPWLSQADRCSLQQSSESPTAQAAAKRHPQLRPPRNGERRQEIRYRTYGTITPSARFRLKFKLLLISISPPQQSREPISVREGWPDYKKSEENWPLRLEAFVTLSVLQYFSFAKATLVLLTYLYKYLQHREQSGTSGWKCWQWPGGNQPKH